MILKVDILETIREGQEVIFTFGWDSEKEEIIVVKEKIKGTAKRFLDQRYRGKDMQFMTVADGKRFIQELHYGVSGIYLRATKAY